ncbi:baseplate wedge subunit [uncultured Caudovirales phage]|uniref:Baseplate wedge subunit n=1 Tax=uncultured Caudovirales phage TaxID=2100421 RepID=A0A6J5M9U8_9CAUD|nr:baseplate wedge subunit [uncultured Caudovirales phage]
MAYIIQVNPVDLEKNVALGLDLPLTGERGATFKQNYFTMDQAEANAKNLLLTEPGERVMLPEFGCGLKRTIFENLTAETTKALEMRIKNSFQTFLPYIFIQKLELTPDEDRNTLFVKMDISLDELGFDTRSILLEVNG